MDGNVVAASLRLRARGTDDGKQLVQKLNKLTPESRVNMGICSTVG